MKNKFSFAMSLAVILAMLVTAVALASTVDESIVDTTTPTGTVTLNPGGSGSITINLSVTGRQQNPASFDVYTTWTLSGGSFVGSNPQTFNVPARAATDSATTFSTLGTVTVDSGQGAGTFILAVGAFNIVTSAPAALGPGTPSNYEVKVEIPTPADTAAPNISCTPPTDSVWYGSDVSVPCTASDSESGLANSADASFSLSTSVAAGTETATAQTNSHPVCDNAGNCETAGPYTFMVDKKAPQITACDSPDGLWHAGDATLNCQYADNGSGPATQNVALSTNVAANTETNNALASANSAQACDGAGNCAASPADIGGNMVDKKAPEFTCGLADADWHAADQTVNCTASDGGSGLTTPASFTLSTSVASGTETDSAYTASQAVTDGVGHTVTAGPVGTFKIDKKAPSVSCGSADGAWHAGDVSIACTASDAGSGLATPANFLLSTNVLAGTEDANASTGTAAVTDNVGNSNSAGPITGNKVDKKGPALACVGSPVYTLNQAGATVSANVTDLGSGPAASPVSDSALTHAVGSFTAPLTGYDNVGNSMTVNCSYSVVYNWSGFFQPVDNNELNIAKAGQAIPLKWRLTDANGNPVLSLVSVRVTVASLTCGSGVTGDLLEEYAAGASGLQNLGDGYYQFNWKTPTTYASSCKTMNLDLGEGTGMGHTATFQFKK